MVFGELVAQNLAVAKPLRDGARGGRPAGDVLELFTPLIKLTNGTANWILRRLGIEPAEELRSARSPQELGVAGPQLGAARVAGRGHRRAGGPLAAVRRADRGGADDARGPKIEALQADETVADLVAKAMETGYSRFPIVEGDLDETIGIVHVKQVFEVPPERPGAQPGWPTWPSRWPRCRRPSTATR